MLLVRVRSLIFVAISALGRRADAASPMDRPESAVQPAAIVQEFAATLNEESRPGVCFPFDAAERRRWGRGPGRRPGLAWKDMTTPQRDLLDRLFKTVLSESGLARLDGIRKEQDLLGANEEGMGYGYFWFAVYGEPGRGRWAWRFGGHHVSLHLTYSDDELAGSSPVFLGGQMLDQAREGWSGYERLRPRETLFRKLIAGLDGEHGDRARLDARVTGALLLSEPEHQPLGPPEAGVALSDLSAAQRAVMNGLIDEYVSVFTPPVAEKLTGAFRADEFNARFAWSGSREPGELHYYRIQSRGFLIEYSNSGSHLHTLIRTEQDWGGNVARP